MVMGPFVPKPSITGTGFLAGHIGVLRHKADVLQTLTFMPARAPSGTVGLEGRVDEMNREAARIARGWQARLRGGARRRQPELRWASGPKTLRPTEVPEAFDRQPDVIIVEGADFVAVETLQLAQRSMIAAEVIKATGLPAMVTMGPDNDPNSFEGYSPGESR